MVVGYRTLFLTAALGVVVTVACGGDDQTQGSGGRSSAGTAGNGTSGGKGGKGGNAGASAEAGASGKGGAAAAGGSSGKGGSAGDDGAGRGGSTGGKGQGGAGGLVDDAGASGQAGEGGAGGEGPTCQGFQGLGDLAGGTFASFATALSRDGSTVVGRGMSASGPEAMRWRAGTGMVGLGDLSGGTFSSKSYDVSADGRVVVGGSDSSLVDCPGRTEEAFRWTEGGGMVALGDLATGCFFSAAYAVSADGTLIGGPAENALANTAATWSSADGWTDLGFATSTDNSSAIAAVTPDKQWFAGTHRIGATAEYQVFRWSSAGGQELLGDLPGGIVYASANAVSDDGSVLVGFGTADTGLKAFRWTSDDGLVDIGDFPSGAADSWAEAIAPDGSLMVGYGTTADGKEAAIWQTPSSIERVVDVLSSHGVTVPSGWTLTDATGISVAGDVVTIAGTGTNPDGDTEAWVASYCVP
jgi:probable HAF family extracellular repeat protein